MAAQGGSDDSEIALAVIIGAVGLVVWYIIPQVIMIPLYGIRYAESYIMQYIPLFGIDKTAATMLHYLQSVDPMSKGYRDWILNMYESQLFYVFDIILGAGLVYIAQSYQKRLDAVSVRGTSVDPEWLIANLAKVDYPHLRPFVNFNPLTRSETKGVWRLPETMMEFTRTHNIMPMCKGCNLPLFAWNDNGKVECESHHDKRNLLQGAKERYCRVKQPEDAVYFFDKEKALKLFLKQVEANGLMPENAADIPKLLESKPHAYMAMAVCLSRLEEEGFAKQENTDALIADMANMVKGYRNSDGIGVYNDKMVDLAYKNASRYMNKDVIEKYPEPLDRHGYITTYLIGLLDYVHLEKGVLPTSLFSHMIGFDRPLFYALNSAGSPSPLVEAWGAHYHFRAEVAVDRPIIGREAKILAKKYTDEYAIAMGDGDWNP